MLHLVPSSEIGEAEQEILKKQTNASSILQVEGEVCSNHDFVSGCTDTDDNNYNLTSLNLEVTGEHCSHLQPFFESLQQFGNLKTLQILDGRGISSDWLHLIPPNVTDLGVHYLTTFPTANQLSTLPTCLRYWDLYVAGLYNNECDWTDETLQSLPRSLHRLWITASAFPNLTERMYDYLPPNLQFSCLKYKTLGSEVCFVSPWDRV